MHFKHSIQITMGDHDSHGDIIRIERILSGKRFNKEITLSLGQLTTSTQNRIARLMRQGRLDISGGEIEIYILKSEPAKTIDEILKEHRQRGEAERAFLAKLTGKSEAQIERDLTRKDKPGGS
jgi:hypothetical protein